MLLPLVALPIVGIAIGRAQVVWHVALLYVVITFGLRALGKREVGQLSPLELVTLMLIPEIASPSLTSGDETILTGVIGISTLLVVVFVLSLVSYRFKRVGEIVDGKPSVLVKDGAFILEVLHRERIQPEEVYASMHEEGIEHISDVRWAILEADGKLTFIPAKD